MGQITSFCQGVPTIQGTTYKHSIGKWNGKRYDVYFLWKNPLTWPVNIFGEGHFGPYSLGLVILIFTYLKAFLKFCKQMQCITLIHANFRITW